MARYAWALLLARIYKAMNRRRLVQLDPVLRLPPKRHVAAKVEVMKLHPNPGIVENLQKFTAAHAELGDLQRAREYWNKCLEIDPEWSADKLNALAALWSFDKETGHGRLRQSGNVYRISA